MSAPQTKSRVRSVWFWAGMLLATLGTIAGLALSGAIASTTALVLMLLPVALTIPLMRAAGRRRDGSACGKGEAQKRYVKRVALFTALYLLSFATLTYATAHSDPAFALRSVLAVLPGLAVIGIFWAVGRLIVEERDEFIRMLVVRQSLIATGIALSAATVWGFLETADVVPHLDAYWVAVAWFIGLIIGALSNRIDYGSWGAV